MNVGSVEGFGACFSTVSVDNPPLSDRISIHAGVAELADALRSGRSEHSARESSNLSFGIKTSLQEVFIFPWHFPVHKWFSVFFSPGN